MSDEALFTDLYQLTMLNGYFQHGMHETAVFELFVRKLPQTRGFLVAAGLEQLLDFLETLRFEPAELAYLAKVGGFGPKFREWLAALRFSGDVDAIPEGTIVFENEPLVRVVAPLSEAQLIETRLINLIHLQTVLASKAARCVLAASGKQLVDFGVRRAHGFEAGLMAARAAYLSGFDGTSTLLAGRRFGIPVFGTMAHSFIQAHRDELEAFRNFARANPEAGVFLIDTYDTEAATRKVVRLAGEGVQVRGVRIDSGDLLAQARAVRLILDHGGLQRCTIFASGDLDEAKLRALMTARAPIDGFGVGTRLDTSADAPYLDCAYKLQEYAGRARRKRSQGKATWPGRKQVYRSYDQSGRTMAVDTVTLIDDPQSGEPLLVPVMRGGRRLAPTEPLSVIRERTAGQLKLLPEHLRALDVGPRYPVEIASSIRRLAEAMRD